MIGVFDSGHGGLTVLKALVQHFPDLGFVYLGDHANAPYGNRSSDEIVDLTKQGVETLFGQGCQLVLLGCNTATSIACRTLQQNWLPRSQWQGSNVLGIIAPTVEVATQTPWGVNEPQYPQMYKEDVIAVFATQRTIESGVFDEEIKKRCPQIDVISQVCPDLAGAIENGAGVDELDGLVGHYVSQMQAQAGGKTPHWAILGCTHYPLVEDLFAKHLPASCRVLSQPTLVARALGHYLRQHPDYIRAPQSEPDLKLLTTGNVEVVEQRLAFAWAERPGFQSTEHRL